MPVIHVSGFRKTYGSTVAVDDVSFDVNAGEISVRGVARVQHRSTCLWIGTRR